MDHATDNACTMRATTLYLARSLSDPGRVLQRTAVDVDAREPVGQNEVAVTRPEDQ